ncbi:bifunctional RNase H/acid phosphatase [Cellulomonas sp. PhB143]|uniref:bifunctional RNase H/acid phosphatase n=1 Tax=Cellulomonas sp. PhB143 TaxID=2485186 RepID=UPI000F46D2C0|nr:bifunctional RNase H/acid phosphatase [Cellulomonas sp. PhB143]ROS73064.1 putative phosphoglycerate mutase [Cellulomonas sp. PhB143]
MTEQTPGPGGRLLVVEADGGSRGNPGPSGYGALVLDPTTGDVLAERAGFLGTTTNNVAEYHGLVAGLRAVAEIDPDAQVQVRMDSRLVVEQMSGRWQTKHAEMRRLAAEAHEVLPPERVTFVWVPRAENAAADRLANEAMDSGGQIARDYPHAPAPARERPAAGAAGTGPTGASAGVAGAADTLTAPAALAAERAVAEAPATSARRRGFDPSQAATLVLVRHGQTALTVDGAYSGAVAPGPSLTTRGQVQAAHAADLVHRIGRDAWPDLPRASSVVSSPIARAAETAAAVGRRLGRLVTTDDRLAECSFGAWEGMTALQIAGGWPGELERWYETGTHRPPGGESAADVGARVQPVLDEIVATGAGRTTVVVGHTVQIRSAIGLALDAPPGRWSTVRLPPASLTVLRVWPGGVTEVVAVGVPSDH